MRQKVIPVKGTAKKTGFTAISRFEVANGMEDEVRQAFVDRPRLVEEAEGFLGLSVVTPKNNPAQFWLITHWEDESSFHLWHKHHRRESHQFIPKGMKVLKGSFSLDFFDHVTT